MSRNKVFDIANKKNNGACAFWTGHPHPETEILYLKQTGLSNIEEIYQLLNDDCRWISACSSYKHPEGKPMFDTTLGRERHTLSEGGFFAESEDLSDVDKFPWPEIKHLDFKEKLETISKFSDKAVFSGFWSHFFHIVCDFFGMENYFIKMYTDPELVLAVTEKVVDFFVEANDKFLQAAGNSFDIVFMGNDFGTQRDLLISPECFDKFVLPGFKRLIEVAKKHGKKVMLHSCGSIYRVIPKLIDAGVDILHPLQALAENMGAEKLAREFKNDIAFCGGVDTQNLLVNATPSQIREEVLRLRDIFGSNYIVSPSHEALLPNVPFENVLAMAKAAKE